MGIFGRKNPNEVNYSGGEKHFLDTIKNSGDGNLLLWRQPEEDFNTNSVLIVNPGEEAIFIKNGEIINVFQNGRYELKTENYPFLSRIRNALSGGISTYNCIVIFVRKSHSAEILWGTSNPIQLRDPVEDIAVTIQAFGSYKIQIDKPELFLTKMVGNNIQNVSQDSLYLYFNNQFQRKIKSFIAHAIKAAGIETLELNAYLDDFSECLLGPISDILADYGIGVVDFSISSMNVPLDDPNRQDLESAHAEKRKLGIYGDDFDRIKVMEILTNFSKNPGAGEGVGLGVGMGAGIAVGGTIGGAISNLVTNTFGGSNDGSIKTEPVKPQPNTRFGPSISENPPSEPSQSQPQAEAPKSPVEKMRELKQLLDMGAISQEEFDAVKKDILDSYRR